VYKAPVKLLFIDDDKELANLLTEYLSFEGYQLHCCYDGLSGLKEARDPEYSLILLDVMMPGLTGFEVLQALGGKHTTPILMLTAKGDEADKILGLELGADDYLTKPFQHRELLARINAILRRIDIVKNRQAPASLIIKNHVSINHANHKVHCHGQLVELTGTEYQILELLMKSANNIVSKADLSQKILQRKLSPFDRSIDMHISNIRRKFLPFSPNDKFKTIRGSGYIFLTGEG
jgi:two-component system response regulator CpxR